MNLLTTSIELSSFATAHVQATPIIRPIKLATGEVSVPPKSGMMMLPPGWVA